MNASKAIGAEKEKELSALLKAFEDFLIELEEDLKLVEALKQL